MATLGSAVCAHFSQEGQAEPTPEFLTYGRACETIESIIFNEFSSDLFEEDGDKDDEDLLIPGLIDWNDMEERTLDEVVDILEAAAELAESKV